MSDCKITVVVPETVGTISPEIYGHFVEHIGGVIYDGLWVGKDSDIPNIQGFRKDVLEKFKAICPPVLRWGGCFSETYNWRDGIGQNRPIRPSWWTFMNGRYETNEVGTHEFVQLCEFIGAKPYFAVNVTSMTPMDARDWVDYCLSPRGATTLAIEREKNGHAEPFDIPYWGLGNENWGGGGKMTAEQYVATYRKYAMVVQNAAGKSKIIAGAGNPHGYAWVRTFLSNLEQKTGEPLPLDGISIHHYCSGGDAIDFNQEDWEKLLKSAKKMEEYIKRHKAFLCAHGLENVKLYVDEWGCMHPSGTECSSEKHLYQQQSTMRDAVITAYNLNLFNNQCDCVYMANVAQTVNCLHSLFLTDKHRFIVTPVYYVFDMFKQHQNGRCMRVLCDNEEVSVSISEKENVLMVTLANLSYEKDINVSLEYLGQQFSDCICEKTTLYSQDVHAYNTFDEPNKIVPKTEVIKMVNSVFLPRLSVVSMKIWKEAE